MNTNNLDIYKKILNLKNLTDVSYLFDNVEYLDNVFNKFNNLYNIQKDVLVEENYYPENFKILEMLLVKEKHTVFYNIWKYFYEPTVFKYYSSDIVVRVSADPLVPYSIILEEIYLEELNKDFFVTAVDEGTKTITLSEDILTPLGLSVLNTNFVVRQFGYDWVGTKIENVGGFSVITLSDFKVSGYIYDKESLTQLRYRIKVTAEIRKSFLMVLEKEMVSKGTIDFMVFVLKFFYLIKYYNVNESLDYNIQDVIFRFTDSILETGVNFAYTINAGSVSKAEWETYIKPIVHPYGWICFYLEAPPIINTIEQPEMNLLKNRVSITDVLKPKYNIVLGDLANVKRYGNIKLDHTIFNRSVNSCPFNLGGKYSQDNFYLYGEPYELVERYDIKLPMVSYVTNNSSTVTLKCIDYETDNTYGTIKTYYSANLSSFLDVAWNHLPYGATLWATPGVNKAFSITGDKIYFQTVIDAGAGIVVAKSDIVVFVRSAYSEALAYAIRQPDIEPSPAPPILL